MQSKAQKTGFVILMVMALSSFSLTLGLNGDAFAKVSDDVLWSAERPLQWADFSGTPDYENDFVKALTASSIRYSYGCENGYINYHIESVFKKSQSWVKEEARTTYHLSHEQLHFDITELYARKLRNALDKKQFPCHRMYAFEQTIRQYLQDWRNEQSTYDKETFFSVKRAEQADWEFEIRLLLDARTYTQTSIEENEEKPKNTEYIFE